MFCGCCSSDATTSSEIAVGKRGEDKPAVLPTVPEVAPVAQTEQTFLEAEIKAQEPAVPVVPVEAPAATVGESGQETSRSNKSNSSRLSKMTPEEKEKEKARLQKLVKEFAREAVAGIALECVADDGSKCSATFVMDRYLTKFDIKDAGNHAAVPLGEKPEVQMKDIIAVYKGTEIPKRVPTFQDQEVCGDCVGLEVKGADGSTEGSKRLHFKFADAYVKDKFYTCLKILRLSVDVNSKKA
eukprot:GDKI01008359.1.p1 GENE.GDKI01008359.1~~GDKI01008359.1.p1  ORF type:complete len:264 (+),score=95.08 GDKI01008359.1:70-792(+)